jgi:predicted nuclease of predicted toxin-antitoxin system
VRFLVDANLPRSVVTLLRNLRHDVEFVRDIGLGAAADSHIAARAKTIAAVILTRDLDFADVRLYPPEEYSGIVVLRLHDGAIAQDIVRVVERFARMPEFLDSLDRRLAIVESHRVRFRPPLREGRLDSDRGQ